MAGSTSGPSQDGTLPLPTADPIGRMASGVVAKFGRLSRRMSAQVYASDSASSQAGMDVRALGHHFSQSARPEDANAKVGDPSMHISMVWFRPRHEVTRNADLVSPAPCKYDATWPEA